MGFWAKKYAIFNFTATIQLQLNVKMESLKSRSLQLSLLQNIRNTDNNILEITVEKVPQWQEWLQYS